MKKAMTAMMALAGVLGPTVNALASTGAREDSSMFLVWAFLGLCALIVVVQLMPAMFMVFGMLKGLLQGGRQSQVEVHSAKEE